jgi:hypothetical protein
VTRKNLHHHFLPHHHDGQPHHAHALSVHALFIYLQLFVIVAAGLYFVRLAAPRVLGAVTFSSDQIINLTNIKRAQNGLPALSNNGLLAAAATAKASDMFANDYWAHNSPQGKTPWVFITGAGYRYLYAGENLARDFNDAGSVVEAWMNSPSHRSNLLDKNFKEIGVAVADGKLGGHEGILVVQMFGAGSGAVANLPSATNPPAAQPQVKANQNAVPTASPQPSQAPLVARPPTTIAQPPVVPTEVTVLSSRQFSIAKGISLALIGFIFSLFTLEILITLRRAHIHLRSAVIAHAAILAFVLFAVWYSAAGAII